MSDTPLFEKIVIGFALVTSLGILLHDTKFDEAVALAVPVIAVTVGAGLHHAIDSSDSAHTHVERVSVAQHFSGMPRAQARDDHRKYLMPKYTARNNPFLSSAGVVWPNV
ncbi:hypothetical protein KC953_02580 [Candidatus Saccharibacteria bacterium]|nr:hypothetical protein [Candidatus Saccharibacteria bacterium]